MILFLLGWLSTAFAITPTDLESKLNAVAQHRASRINPHVPNISMSQSKQTASGAVVTGQQAGPGGLTMAYGVAIIDAPIGLVWSALNDETRATRYTAVEYAEIVSGSACGAGRQVFNYLEINFMVGNRWWVGLPKENTTLYRNSGGSVRELMFTSTTNASLVTSASAQSYMASATPINSSEGGWFLVALDSRNTYVEYHVTSDPGGRIPASLASTFATTGVKNQIAAIRNFAKGGNPSCPVR